VVFLQKSIPNWFLSNHSLLCLRERVAGKYIFHHAQYFSASLKRVKYGIKLLIRRYVFSGIRKQLSQTR
jgi:hypothetical protein